MKKTSLESFIPKKQKCMWTIAANFILNHFFLHIFEFENVKSRWHPKLQSEFLLEQQMLLEFISNSKWICLHNVLQNFRCLLHRERRQRRKLTPKYVP